MKRCLADGVMPGFFDWYRSGLGPGGRYWDHPKYYERDRDLHRKYQPLCQALAKAGWEPVTFARSSEPNVFVERFGPTPEGVVWLTLLNEDSKPHVTRLTVDAKSLGLKAASVQALDVLTGTPVALSRKGALAADLEVPADGVMVIQLAEPKAAAQWRLEQAAETLALGHRMRQVDRGKPPLAVHWHPSQRPYGRQRRDGKWCLVLSGGEGASTCEQWAMLFQAKPEPLKLRVRSSGQDLVGGPGTIGVECQLAWVTPD